MTTISEHFALLAAGATLPSEGQMLTRPVGVEVAAGAILAGIDHFGQRHLLVPVADEPVTSDRASQGVVLEERHLTVGERDTRFADLACLVSRLNGPFEQLVADVAGRLEGSSSRPAATVSQTLDDWRSLLRAAIGGLSHEAMRGLVGELDVLARLAKRHPIEALDAWKGPTGATHDFSRDGRSIEVKATASVSATSVRISNLDQMDSSLARDLFLVVVHLHESADAPDIDERVEALISMGLPAGGLQTRLQAAGFFAGTVVDGGTRYEVRSTRVWRVGAEFPVLRGSTIAPNILSCIENVKYDLLLAGLPYPLTDADGEAFLTDWVSGA